MSYMPEYNSLKFYYHKLYSKIALVFFLNIGDS